jgi:hypothetical protein
MGYPMPTVVIMDFREKKKLFLRILNLRLAVQIAHRGQCSLVHVWILIRHNHLIGT